MSEIEAEAEVESDSRSAKESGRLTQLALPAKDFIRLSLQGMFVKKREDRMLSHSCQISQVFYP